MLKISGFTPFRNPQTMNNDTQVCEHKKGEACAQQFAYSTACPAFSADWELCGTGAFLNTVHSLHSHSAKMWAGEIFLKVLV